MINQATSNENGSHSGFDIRDHLAALELKRETQSEYECVCPICSDDNLKINKRTGAYKCWSTGCETRLIRDAIAPLNYQRPPKQRPDRPTHTAKPKSPKVTPFNPGPNQRPAATSNKPVTIELVTLPEIPDDIPQPFERFDPQRGQVIESIYRYSETQWVVRAEWENSEKSKGYSKDFRQWHRDSSGKPVCKKGDQPWPAYRIEECLSRLESHVQGNKPVLLVGEGEKVVEFLRSYGLAAITLQGSNWSGDAIISSIEILAAVDGLTLAFIVDNDQPGHKKAVSFQAACCSIGLDCVLIDPLAIDPTLPPSGDIADIDPMQIPDWIQRLENEIHQAVNARADIFPTVAPSQEVRGTDGVSDWTFPQIAAWELFGYPFDLSYERWISLDDKLYEWVGTHYQEQPTPLVFQRITEYCNDYAIPLKDESGKVVKWKYPFADPSYVAKVWSWIVKAFAVDPNTLNPPGLNCTNGVLEICWDGDRPSWELVPHDPEKHLYLYKPLPTFDPNADPEWCDRILECLDQPQREILLRTIAASLDLNSVRQRRGRLVRSLLLKGDGSNGKDTVRELVALLYSNHAISSVGLSDFAQYDQGRKFPLASLQRSRVNWSSENADFAKLDKLQSLKAVVTGDPIAIERKGKDEFTFNPKCINLFNVNDTPNLSAAMEAIASRYGVLTFNKTYAVNPDPAKGELQAIAWFKYDPQRLIKDVLPAFLNKVLASLVTLMEEGIDYSPTLAALEELRQRNSHLWQAIKDLGIEYTPDRTSRLYASEVWERLRQWYIDNGTLIVEVDDKGKERSTWIDQVRASDKNVKGPNQVITRLQQLFPKAGRGSAANRAFIVGLRFKDEAVEATNPPSEDLEPLHSEPDKAKGVILGANPFSLETSLEGEAPPLINDDPFEFSEKTDRNTRSASLGKGYSDSQAPKTASTASCVAKEGIKVGVRVGKVGNIGWNGEVLAIDSDQATVLWGNDIHPVTMPLSSLRLLD